MGNYFAADTAFHRAAVRACGTPGLDGRHFAMFTPGQAGVQHAGPLQKVRLNYSRWLRSLLGAEMVGVGGGDIRAEAHAYDGHQWGRFQVFGGLSGVAFGD